MAASTIDSVTIVGNVKLDTGNNAYVPGEGNKNSRYQFSIAVTPRVKNPNTNQWEDGVTTWHNYVTAWGPIADNAHASLKNGDQVIVIGHNQTREYTDKEGNKKVSTNVVADFIGLSLRWGVAELQKESRGGSSRSYSRPSEPAATRATEEPRNETSQQSHDDGGNAFASDNKFDDLFN